MRRARPRSPDRSARPARHAPRLRSVISERALRVASCRRRGCVWRRDPWLMNAGSALGGLVYGNRGWHDPLQRSSSNRCRSQRPRGLSKAFTSTSALLAGRPWDGARRSVGGVPRLSRVVRGGRRGAGPCHRRFAAGATLGRESLVHATATRFERVRQVRAELFKELVVRLELIAPR